MTVPATVAREKKLRLRKRFKEKKPNFVRQESWKYMRLKENWRRPRGMDNKVRKRIKGWPARVSAGYRGPKASRKLHPSGFEEVLIYTVEDLTRINPETQAARIAHNVGKKKKIKIIAEARKKKIEILNLGQGKEVTKKEEKPTEETETEEVKTEETMKTEEPKLEDKASKRRKKVEKK
jgi:large subunit ribosomal protein L32e